MKPIYLIHAKTDQAKKQLEEDGAVPFSSDTFLWDQDPSTPTTIAKEKSFLLPDEALVLDLFVPNSINELDGDHPHKAEIESLMSDLWRMAFQYSKSRKRN
jgi:hypothetical protein